MVHREIPRPDLLCQTVAILPGTNILLGLIVALLSLKFIFIFAASPTPDEAYYWLWGQHLALSYFDHPPMIAWTQRLAAALFGWNLFALRAMTLLTYGGSLWLLWFWSRRLAGTKHAVRIFLAGTVVWLAMPILMRFQSVAHPDHLLIFFGLITGHFWALFLIGRSRNRASWRYYYFGCIALGLAGLSKYNAVLIAGGFAFWVLFSPNGRALLRLPHMWGGGIVALLIQAPVFFWNFDNGWPSFRYNLYDRIGQSIFGGFSGNTMIFIFSSVLMLSPVLLPALYRFITDHQYVFQPFGRITFAVSSIFFIVLSSLNTILFYWNVVAYLGFFPVAIFYLRSRREFRLHAIFGIWMGLWMVLIFVLAAHKLAGIEIRDVDISYGLDQIGTIVEKEEARFGADLVMTSDYRTASLLSYSLKRLDIGKLGKRRDQFDFWFDPTLHKGASAIVLVDDFFSEKDKISEMFGRVNVLYEFTSQNFGLAIHKYKIVYAENLL